MNESMIHVYAKDEVNSLSIISICIILIAVPANILVLVGYLTSRSLRGKPSSLLLVSMTLAELLACALVLPSQLMLQVMQPSMVAHGGGLCTFVGGITNSFYIVITETLVFMSIDRYYAVSSMMRYQSIMNQKRVFAMIVFTWVHCIIYVLILAPFVVEVDYNPRLGTCGIIFDDRIAMLASMALVYIVIPFVLVFVFNWKMAMYLRSHNRSMMTTGAVQPTDGRNGRNIAREAQERKVACMVSWLIITCFVCWLPVVFISILQVTPAYPSPFANAITYLILHLSEISNPMLNLYHRKDIRDAIKRFCLSCLESLDAETEMSAVESSRTNSRT